MRPQRTTFQLGLFIAGVAALAMFPLYCVMAQIVPPLPSQTGSVTGIVRTPDGAPAPNVRVTALRAEMVDDAVRAMASLAQTDSAGRYRLENVPPGRYYITAGRVDLPTYYPGTLDIARGTTVSINSAAIISDINIVIQDTSAALPAGGPGLRGRGATPFGNAVAGAIAPPPQVGQRRGGPAAPGAPGTPGLVLPVFQPTVVLRGGPFAPASQPGAAWWTDAALVARLGVTEDQRKKIEGIAEQHRQTLAQNKTDLDREEAALARMLQAEIVEPASVVAAQSERVVQARGELERTNSKMTLQIRENLTRSQWVQLQAETLQLSIAPQVIVPGGRSSGPRGGAPGIP